MSKRKLKDLVRHLIKVLHLSFFLNKYRTLKGQDLSHLSLKGRQDRFVKIYESGIWLNERKTGSLSGQGSDAESTQNIREELPRILTALKVGSLLDIGCGDWSWMQHMDLPCAYIGVDIVPPIIERNKNRFDKPHVVFQVLDAVIDALPPSDAILCREVIFHLSFSDAKRLLNNISATNARYFIATSDSDVINADIQTGDFRDLNLRLKPFSFPPPIISVLDNSVSKGRKIEVWNICDLPRF